MAKTKHVRLGLSVAVALLMGLLVALPVSAAGRSLEVQAFNFGFEGIPTRLAAGTYAVSFANDNDIYSHELLAAKLAPGHENVTRDEAITCADNVVFKNNFDCFAGAQFVTIASPDTVAQGSLTLEPGKYLYLCGIPDRNGQPHYQLGMLRFLSVS